MTTSIRSTDPRHSSRNDATPAARSRPSSSATTSRTLIRIGPMCEVSTGTGSRGANTLAAVFASFAGVTPRMTSGMAGTSSSGTLASRT